MKQVLTVHRIVVEVGILHTPATKATEHIPAYVRLIKGLSGEMSYLPGGSGLFYFNPQVLRLEEERPKHLDIGPGEWHQLIQGLDSPRSDAEARASSTLMLRGSLDGIRALKK